MRVRNRDVIPAVSSVVVVLTIVLGGFATAMAAGPAASTTTTGAVCHRHRCWQPSPTPTAPAPTTTAPATGRTCTNPVWVDSTGGGTSEGAYYLQNNMWNVAGYQVKETMSACSHASWNVVATADNSSGDGAVKTYPNTHRDFHNWGTGYEPPLSSFSTITSRFAQTSPGVGIYDVAYDIWLNGVASSGSTEVMIWTDNRGQRPLGSKVGQVTLSGHTWDVWSANSNHYLAFVPVNNAVVNSGNLDLKGFFGYLTGGGYLSATSTLGQICYGVEVVSTDGAPARWDFTDFDVTTS